MSSKTVEKRQSKKKLIGLIGEDPNDTSAIRLLLEQKYSERVSFKPLLQRVRGDQLNSNKMHRQLQIECRAHKPDVVLFIKDADGIRTQADKIKDCHEWYKRYNKDVNCSHALLINIYELEALIFADIEAFNKEYKTNIKGGMDVTLLSEPKEKLIQAIKNNCTCKDKCTCKLYHPNNAAKIFEKMNVGIVRRNCNYFDTFMKELEALVAAK